MSDVPTYSDEQINAAVAEYAPVSEDIDIAIEAMHREIASLRTQLDQERQRREQAEGLLRKYMTGKYGGHSGLMGRIDKHFGEWDG